MSINKAKLKQFVKDWTGIGNEKQHTMKFWIELLSALGVGNPTKLAEFERPVIVNGGQKYIDVYLGDVKVLVEQKSLGISLNASELQSDGIFLTPYQQAKRYFDNLPLSEKPEKIITCNFGEFRIHDMEAAQPELNPEIIELADLEKDAYLLGFLTAFTEAQVKREEDVSVKAGAFVSKLKEALLSQYDENDMVAARNVNILCVRLVFLYYCEDAGIFEKNQFLNYLKASDVAHIRRDLLDLFQVLNTEPDKRDKFLPPVLAAFKYCNGGLFAEHISLPCITQSMLDLIIDASESFDWEGISPTIFGACFESTLNPETRRSGGMHYTSIENIHKVIDPLFLDDLKTELTDIISEPVAKTKEEKLERFQKKIAGLKFLDPACGSGNFLTETYLCLRRLENTVIQEKIKVSSKIVDGQIIIGEAIDPIKVSIQQLYGIEINDFAVSVAMTALWIAEAQMMKETEAIVAQHLDFLPLKTLANIHEGNALRIDWKDVVPKYKLSYIMGNPPFVGGMLMSKEQKAELIAICGDIKGIGEVDYVAGWYWKCAEMIQGTNIRCALVSTNSITQGEQPAIAFKDLYTKYDFSINFAYKTFIWDSEASVKAHVHCIIIGFSSKAINPAVIFNSECSKINADNINAYLLDAPNVFVESNTNTLCEVPKMCFGNMPRDGGGFILSKEEKDDLIHKEPLSEKWIHSFPGATEFINGKERYCLWLKDADPSELKKCPTVMSRIASVRDFRAKSKASSTRKMADTPNLFAQITQPEDSPFVVVPRHSSQRRRYIPMGFMGSEVVASDSTLIVPDASLYTFGVLTSNVHMSWVRAVCGRIKSDYRYSKEIVYNNFPWPTPTDVQKSKIEATAQGILDARALYPEASLADLYDELSMPVELRKAHQANDRAVMEAYGIGPKDPEFHDEAACVAMLMKMYQNLTDKA